MQRIDFPIINNDSSIFVQANEYFYYKDMKKSSELEIYEERLIIDWGRAALSRHRWSNKSEKKVYQILPKGFYANLDNHSKNRKNYIKIIYRLYK